MIGLPEQCREVRVKPLGYQVGCQMAVSRSTRLGIVGLSRDFGAGTRTRTEDLLITNQLLYQLSYAGQACGSRRGLKPYRT